MIKNTIHWCFIFQSYFHVYFILVSVYAAPPPPRPSTVTPQASVPIFQSTDQSPPHTGASFPPPPTLQQPIAYTLPGKCTKNSTLLLAPAVTVGERRELWILPPFFFGLFFCL